MTPNIKKPRASKKVYAVYKGDEFIVVGSAKDCCDYLGVKLNYFYSLMKKKNTRWDVIKVEI